MNRTSTLASMLILCLFFLWACDHREEYTFIAPPQTGDFCYAAPNGKEYIHLSLNKGELKGTLIDTTENKPLISAVSGSIVPGDDNETAGTHIRVTLSHADVSVDQNWRVGFEKDGIRIKYDVNALEFTSYKAIPCDSITAIDRQLQRNILVYKSRDFIVPTAEPVCYEATRPANGSYLSGEYIQLWLTGGKVKGRGAGHYTGNPVWDFDFHGTWEKNTMRVTINYRETGEEPHTVMETWTIDPKTQRLHIKNHSTSVLAANEYVKADNKDFLNFIHAYFEKEDRVR